jgi:hypothetical protein
MNPEVRNLNKEVQNIRYDHYEKLRQDSIKAVKDERTKLIEGQKNNTHLGGSKVT